MMTSIVIVSAFKATKPGLPSRGEACAHLFDKIPCPDVDEHVFGILDPTRHVQ